MELDMPPEWKERGFKLVTEQATRLRDFAANPKQRTPTGLGTLDELILGPAWGEVFMFLGRSFTGKSLIATNIMANNEHTGILFFSLEMPEHQVLQRLWAHVSGLPASEVGRMVRHNLLPDSLESQLSDFANHVIIDRGSLSLGDMSAYVGAYESYFNRRPDLVIIDYLELVGGGKASAEGWQRTEATAGALKDWAKQEGVGVVVLHQANKSVVAWEEPTEDSAKGGGFVEADVVCGIWRPARDPKLPSYERKLRDDEFYINVMKNRINGNVTSGDPLKFILKPDLTLRQFGKNEQPSYEEEDAA